MAKKKTEIAPKSESAPKPAAKKAPAKKTSPAPAGDLSINTSAAAAAAAALVGNRISVGGAQGAVRAESSAFKQMKESLNKHSAGIGDLLPSTGSEKKSNLPFEQGKHVGKNQTFGADVNRTGVPRRTGG